MPAKNSSFRLINIPTSIEKAENVVKLANSANLDPYNG